METIKDVWYAVIRPDGTINSVCATRAAADYDASEYGDKYTVERVQVVITRIVGR